LQEADLHCSTQTQAIMRAWFLFGAVYSMLAALLWGLQSARTACEIDLGSELQGLADEANAQTKHIGSYSKFYKLVEVYAADGEEKSECLEATVTLPNAIAHLVKGGRIAEGEDV